MDDLRLLDTKALAKILDKSVSTIKRWRREGTLPPPREGFGKAYWTYGQIKLWMDQTSPIRTTTNDGN
jgi:predicted site-specific integrase-resolvase